MKQISYAFHDYIDEHGHLPPAYTVDENGKPLHSWRVLILPYIKQGALYEQIRLDEPWDSEYNRQFHAEAPLIFQCQSGFSRSETVPIPAPGGCFYSVIDGAEAAFFGSQTREFADITSGTSNTIFLVERRIQYIENQEIHHAKRNFTEEYRQFLDRFNIEYDDRYIFHEIQQNE